MNNFQIGVLAVSVLFIGYGFYGVVRRKLFLPSTAIQRWIWKPYSKEEVNTVNGNEDSVSPVDILFVYGATAILFGILYIILGVLGIISLTGSA
jgi:hypothetical protein